MAKTQTPPVVKGHRHGLLDTPWINKDNFHWMIGSQDTGVDSRGMQGLTPYIGSNGNWWIGQVDTGVYAEGGSTPESSETGFM